jgi:malonyl-CoA O-methyltransferase
MLNKFNKVQVAKSFNRATKSYNQVNFIQRLVGDKLFQWIDNLPTQPLKIIDIGCGTGILTMRLAHTFSQGKMLGIDIAAGMIKCAHNNFIGVKNLNFHCADADHLPLADKAADLIFSNLMLQWSPDLKTTLIEFWRVLKPEGSLIFTIFGSDSLKELRGAWSKVDNGVHVSHFVNNQELICDLNFAGFKKLKLETAYCNRTFDSVYDIMQELKMLGAHNLHHDRHKGLFGKKKFEQFQAAYNQYRNSHNKLPLTFEIHYVHAIKDKL